MYNMRYIFGTCTAKNIALYTGIYGTVDHLLSLMVVKSTLWKKGWTQMPSYPKRSSELLKSPRIMEIADEVKSCSDGKARQF